MKRIKVNVVKSESNGRPTEKRRAARPRDDLGARLGNESLGEIWCIRLHAGFLDRNLSYSAESHQNDKSPKSLCIYPKIFSLDCAAKFRMSLSEMSSNNRLRLLPISSICIVD